MHRGLRGGQGLGEEGIGAVGGGMGTGAGGFWDVPRWRRQGSRSGSPRTAEHTEHRGTQRCGPYSHQSPGEGGAGALKASSVPPAPQIGGVTVKYHSQGERLEKHKPLQGDS